MDFTIVLMDFQIRLMIFFNSTIEASPRSWIHSLRHPPNRSPIMSSYEDAVFAACKYGRMEDIDDLLKDNNAKWNIKDELGNSPLHYAAGTLNMLAFERLWLKEGNLSVHVMEKEAKEGQNKQDLVRPEESRFCWGSICLISSYTAEQTTWLSWSNIDSMICYWNYAGAGHHEIVKKLLESGKVDVNAVNGRGDSALHKVRFHIIKNLLYPIHHVLSFNTQIKDLNQGSKLSSTFYPFKLLSLLTNLWFCCIFVLFNDVTIKWILKIPWSDLSQHGKLAIFEILSKRLL